MYRTFFAIYILGDELPYVFGRWCDVSTYCTFDLNSLSGLWKSIFLLRSHWDYWRAGQKNKKSHLWHSLMIGICWEILYLVVDYLGLIHVLRNLDLKLLMVSCARWSGVSAHKGSTKGRAHKENIESKHFKIYLSNFSCQVNISNSDFKNP